MLLSYFKCCKMFRAFVCLLLADADRNGHLVRSPIGGAKKVHNQCKREVIMDRMEGKVDPN